jgi:hypothetical protein
MITVNRISRTRLPFFWLKLEPLITRALNRSQGELDSGDVRDAALRDQMQIWVVRDDLKLVGVASTEVVSYPKYDALRVVTLSGEGMDSWVADLFATLQSFALSIHALKLEAYGRKGFVKKLETFGFVPVYTSIVKDLTTEYYQRSKK